MNLAIWPTWNQIQMEAAFRTIPSDSSCHIFGYVIIQLHSLFKEVLLWSNHRARSADPDPGDGLTCSEAVMLHQVTANQSARPAQTSWWRDRTYVVCDSLEGLVPSVCRTEILNRAADKHVPVLQSHTEQLQCLLNQQIQHTEDSDCSLLDWRTSTLICQDTPEPGQQEGHLHSSRKHSPTLMWSDIKS